MNKIKKISAPVRIDFAGGTTDISPFRDKYGGCVLNAAINRRVTGEIFSSSKEVKLKYDAMVPTSSGLGTSGVMSLVWLALISSERDKKKLAERVYGLEQAMGQVGGKQDQYAGAFGGINFIEFKKDKVKLTPLKLDKEIITELENNLILVYTGKPHLATNSNRSMIDNLRNNKNNLIRIKNIAIDMKKYLIKGELNKFAELMNEEKAERKRLHHSIVPPRLEKIISSGMKNGAVAAKVCGSGGGGSILFYGNKNKLKNKFKDKVIDFKFDFIGLKWH